MEKSLERGEMLEAVLILIAIVSILVFYVLPSRGVWGPSKSFTNLVENKPSKSSRGGALDPISLQAKNVSLETGNASLSINPNEEYITIRNTGSHPIDITGWKLTNAKGSEILIPLASYTSQYVSSDIILQSGDYAFLATGSNGNGSYNNAPEFEGSAWKIYLGRTAELWAKRNEQIKLFDTKGNLVDYTSY